MPPPWARCRLLRRAQTSNSSCVSSALPMFGLPFVERLQVGLQIGHERPIMPPRQSRGDEQGVVDTVGADCSIIRGSRPSFPQYLRAYIHGGRHIDFFHLETCVLQAGLHGQGCRRAPYPMPTGYGCIHIVASVLNTFEDGSHVEARSRMEWYCTMMSFFL